MAQNNKNLHNINMRTITGNLRIVGGEMDDPVAERKRNTALVRPVPQHVRNLVKPVAMKVVRPIPQRVSNQFYKEAFEEGLNLKETSNAAALAHDWHRKWTHQDEQNHTRPDADFYAMDMSASVFDLDRRGARNPSIIASDEGSDYVSEEGRAKRYLNGERSSSPAGRTELLLFNPEDRLSATSWSENSNTSSLSSHMAPQTKRRFVGSPVNNNDDDDDEEEETPILRPVAPLAVRPSAVRPMIVRAVRQEIPPPHDITHGCIPHDIMTRRALGNVSPMSCSEGSASFQAPEMTVVNSVRESVHVVEDYEEPSLSEISRPKAALSDTILSSRDAVLHSLAVSQGDVDSPKFAQAIDPLLKYFSQQELDTRPHLINKSESVDGMWLTLSKPSYFGCLGENDNGDPMYTLGRMAFDMFSPTNLVCSLQGNFNPVEVVGEEERKAMLECVPKSLREEVESGKTVLRTYHVVAAFTIEPALASFPNAPNKDVHRPIKGIMTTYGYSLPDPEVANRHSIWFTGGRIEPNNHPADVFEWKRLFTLHPPKHSWGEKAKLLAVKLLMGATVPELMASDGSMEYTFTRPLGGHGMAYVDVVYLDETLRIVRGHRGTIFVFSRLLQNQRDRLQ